MPLVEEFVSGLMDVVGADAVLTGERIRPDYWVDETLKATRVLPGAVVLPSCTEEVAGIVRLAAAHGIPVTARGAATGLSGGCIPAEDGLVISFERMARLLELDQEEHVAVVQPGLTLAELDDATRACRLVYPVFPGTLSATLGGNVATNAGGMRAVKYGVTRHQVLGLEAVTGSGEVIRVGGRFVKGTSGYDLTQLLVGSEGTLALITEATLKLHPRLAHTAAILAPFGTVDEVARAVPKILASGVQPMILEYIDRSTMRGLLAANDLKLGIPEEMSTRTGAYLVVVLEGRDPDRLEVDIAEVAGQLESASAHEVYVLTSGQAADLLAARENAFWMVKAAGADDLIDMVVPRTTIPEYLRRVQEIAHEHGSKVFGCGHAGDGNIHFSVYEKDEATRRELLHAIYAMGLKLGGAISGEHGIGRTKRGYLEFLESPIKLRIMRDVKGVFDPAGILNPGVLL